MIQNKGSDTLVNVAQAWSEAYRTVNPSVMVSVSGGGSGTGISALINGQVDIANSSRKMKDKEVETAKERGVNPLQHVVGFDALAIFVHRDNPLRELTMAQIGEIYAEGGTLRAWSDLGVTVPGCPSDTIVRVSRQNNSGTYQYFQEATLGGREYELGSLDMHGSKDLVDLVEHTPCAVGYSGLAYQTPKIRMPCVRADESSVCIEPSEASAMDGSYAIARPLFMYTNGEPQGDVRTYLEWVMSDSGQCILRNAGYAPVRDLTCAPGLTP